MRCVSKHTRTFDIFILAVLAILLVVSPLALGSVAPWARSSALLISSVALVVWLLKGVADGRLCIVKSRAWVFILAFFILLLFQVAPFANKTISYLSPTASETYSQAIPDDNNVESSVTISLDSVATWDSMERILILAILFFIVANTVNKRWQIIGLALAMITIGSFEALYGMYEHFSGNNHIFWITREYSTFASSGTFHNKNHFAGLLEMIIPITIALVISADRKPQQGVRRMGLSRFAHSISSFSFVWRAILTLLALIMSLALIFSFSRAGIIILFFQLLVMGMVWAAITGSRHRALLIIAFLALTMVIASVTGVTEIVSNVEEVAVGESGSIHTRLDIWRSGFMYFKDFPILGSGLGTFGNVFPRYQSAAFADGLVDYAHNDWLQLFCETGVAGGIIVIAGLLFFLLNIITTAANNPSSFGKYMTAGCLIAIFGMLVHSFFDFNLSKITSNGIVFATLLGMAYASANLVTRRKNVDYKQRYLELSLTGKGSRILAATLPVLALAYIASTSYDTVMADVYFNKYKMLRHSDTDLYFFLPLSKNSNLQNEHLNIANKNILRAADLKPENSRYLAAVSNMIIKQSDDAIRSRAVNRAKGIVGENSHTDDSGFKSVVSTIKDNLIENELAGERREALVSARDYLVMAIDHAPTVAGYHVGLARIVSQLGDDMKISRREIETAVWLAPNKPSILLSAGDLFLDLCLDEPDNHKSEKCFEETRKYYRKALLAKMSYAEKIYPVVEMYMGGASALADVTPRALRSYEYLCRELWQKGEWGDVLSCLDVIWELAGSRQYAEHPLPTLYDDKGSFDPGIEDSGAEEDAQMAKSEFAFSQRRSWGGGLDRRTPIAIRMSVASRRALVHLIMGKLDEHEEASGEYRKVLSEWSASSLIKAREAVADGRTIEAYGAYMEIVRRDWGLAEVLLDLAELTQQNPALPGDAQWNNPIDHLYRLAIYTEPKSGDGARLTEHQFGRLMSVLDQIPPYDQEDKLVVDFIINVAHILVGHTQKGVSNLENMAREGTFSTNLVSKHLVYNVMGRGYEVLGNRGKAIEAYENAIKWLPTHYPSAKRLATLAGSINENDDQSNKLVLDSLAVDIALNTGFGGKIMLAGISMNEAQGALTLFWRMDERMMTTYYPALFFIDADRNIVSGEHKLLKANSSPYPVDSPRPGEVVLQKVKLPQSFDEKWTMRIKVMLSKPTPNVQRVLNTDFGSRYLEIPLSALAM